MTAEAEDSVVMFDSSAGRPAAASTLHMPVHSEALGQSLGPYKLLQVIGEGGCGMVYMAEQHQPVRRQVAVKIIKLGMDTKQVIARFEAERQALAMMDHPNIAKILDAGATEAGRPYFVMELVRGVSITKYCDENRLNINERLELFKSICSAVQHAHQKGIIHRDIKPSNVLITMHDGKAVPKIIDFGISKAMNQRLTDRTLVTEYHQFIGTPEYMSPEQADTAGGLDVDTRSDIYSLGVVLYELLTGTTPLNSVNLRKLDTGDFKTIIRDTDAPRPSLRLREMNGTLTEIVADRQTNRLGLHKAVRGDLDWITMKCLEKDRTRRYETANDLTADLNRHLSNKPVLASPPTFRYSLGKFLRRNRQPVIWVTVVVAVFVAAVVSLIGLSASEARARSRANQQRDMALLAQANTVFILSMLDDPLFNTTDIRPILDECLTAYKLAGAMAETQTAAVLWALGREEQEHGLPQLAVERFKEAIMRLAPLESARGEEMIFGRFDEFKAFSNSGMGAFRNDLTVRQVLRDSRERLERINRKQFLKGRSRIGPNATDGIVRI